MAYLRDDVGIGCSQAGDPLAEDLHGLCRAGHVREDDAVLREELPCRLLHGLPTRPPFFVLIQVGE